MDNTTLDNLALALNLDTEVWGNTMLDYFVAVGALIILVAVFKTIQWVLLRKLAKLAEKTETDIDDTLIEIVRSLKPGFYYFVAFFFASKFLALTELATTVVNSVLLIWVAVQVVIALQILIDYLVKKKFADLDGDGEPDNGILLFMSRLAKGALWVVALLMILSNMGVNVTGLMAGLGIGGLAIAFALQNVFSDLFASFSIYLDKPFQVGDFIIVGEHIGTVERIGVKSTRLRALQGEEIVISNQELTSARIHNFKKMQERRITVTFGVTYDTPQEKLEKINRIVKGIVDEEELTRFDRIHFKEFGDSALIFELVYYMTSAEYNDYMDAQQSMNFEIRKAFEKEGVEMAFPTQTIYLQKS